MGLLRGYPIFVMSVRIESCLRSDYRSYKNSVDEDGLSILYKPPCPQVFSIYNFEGYILIIGCLPSLPQTVLYYTLATMNLIITSTAIIAGLMGMANLCPAPQALIIPIASAAL